LRRSMVSTHLDALRFGILVAVLAGCTSGSARPAARGPIALGAAAQPGFQPIWVNLDLHPIGQPTAVGSAMVGIVIDGDRLSLVRSDPATGRKRWQQPLATGDIAPGVAVDIAVISADTVAYFRPSSADIYLAHLVIADATTGADLAVSPPERFTSPPYPCPN